MGWLVLAAAVTAGAAGVVALGSTSSRGAESPGPEPSSLSIEDQAAPVAVEPPALASAPSLAEERRRKSVLRVAQAWRDVESLLAEGRAEEALKAALRLKASDPEFFEDAKVKAQLARLQAAAKSGEEAKRLAAAASAAALTEAERAALDGKLAASAEVLAKAANEADLDQLSRHLKRFLLPGAPGASDSKNAADAVLQSFVMDRRARRAQDKRPPVADADAAEQRRVDQLEKLRQRNAVGLLDSIEAGLAWLALHQREDGSFCDQAVVDRCAELKHTPNCLGDARNTGDVYQVAATALATIAFLDFRDQDVNGWFDPYLGRSIEWLKKQQKADGSFGGSGQQYTNAMALMAMGQAAASTGSAELREVVKKGLAYFTAIIGPLGGFRYRPNDPGDLSVTGWVAQAVEASRLSGVEIPPQLSGGLGIFLRYFTLGEAKFVYTSQQRNPSATLAPVGMLVGHLNGVDRDPVVAEAWKAYLKGLPPANRPDLYTLYYGVRVAILLEGVLDDPWRQWVFDLSARQISGTTAAGSFPKDLWRHGSGITVQAAVAVLTMEHALYLR